MRYFFKDFLESFSYLIYAISVFRMLDESRSGFKKILFIYYCFAAFLLLAASSTKNHMANNCIYNIFFFITAGFLSYYFKSIFSGIRKKNIVSFLFITNLLLFIFFDIVLQQIFEYNTYVYAAVFLSIVIYSLLYFEQLLHNVNDLNPLKQFDFWLVSGYLLYFLSSFFIILFYNNVDVNQRAVLWSLQNVILFFSSVISLSGSLWIYYHKKYY